MRYLLIIKILYLEEICLNFYKCRDVIYPLYFYKICTSAVISKTSKWPNLSPIIFEFRDTLYVFIITLRNIAGHSKLLARAVFVSFINTLDELLRYTNDVMRLENK